MSQSHSSQSSQFLRVFVALPLPHEAIHELAAAQHRLNEAATQNRVRLRLTPKHQFHLTLAFLGNVEQTQLSSIFGVTAATTKSCPRCTLRPLGFVALPSANRARVIAISFEEATGQLAAFVAALNAGFRRCGCELEDRAFYAHVTLARMRVAQRAPELSTDVLSAVSPILAREVAVFQSVLKATGAEYHRLLSVEFGAS